MVAAGDGHGGLQLHADLLGQSVLTVLVGADRGGEPVAAPGQAVMDHGGVRQIAVGPLSPPAGFLGLRGIVLHARAIEIVGHELPELLVGEVVPVAEHRVAELSQDGGVIPAGDQDAVLELSAGHADVELGGAGVLRQDRDGAAGCHALRAVDRARVTEGDALGCVLGGDRLGALIGSAGQSEGAVLGDVADRPEFAVGDGEVLAAVVAARGHHVPDVKRGAVAPARADGGVELAGLDPGFLDRDVDRTHGLVVGGHDGDRLPRAVGRDPCGGSLLGLLGAVAEAVDVSVLVQPQRDLVRLLRRRGLAEVAGDLGVGGVGLARVVGAAESVDRVQVHACLVGELRLDQCHRAGVADRADLVGISDQCEASAAVVSDGQQRRHGVGVHHPGLVAHDHVAGRELRGRAGTVVGRAVRVGVAGAEALPGRLPRCLGAPPEPVLVQQGVEAGAVGADLGLRDLRGFHRRGDGQHPVSLGGHGALGDGEHRGLAGPCRPLNGDDRGAAGNGPCRGDLAIVELHRVLAGRGALGVHDGDALRDRLQRRRGGVTDRGAQGGALGDPGSGLAYGGEAERLHVVRAADPCRCEGLDFRQCPGLDLTDQARHLLGTDGQLRLGDGHRCAGPEIHTGEPALGADGALIGPAQRVGRQPAPVHLVRLAGLDRGRLPGHEDGGVHVGQLAPNLIAPLVLVQLVRLLRAVQCPRLPVPRFDEARRGLLPRIRGPPVPLQTGLVAADLGGPLTHRVHDVRQLRDLAIVVERVPVSGQCRPPPGVGPCRQLPARVDENLVAEHLLRVHVGPLPIGALHLGVEPEVAVRVGVQRPGALVVQRHHFDLGQADALLPSRAAAGRELLAPRGDGLVGHAVHQRVELLAQLGVQHRRERVRLRGVDRRVVEEMSVRGSHRAAALLAGLGVHPVDPRAQLLGVELVALDAVGAGGVAGDGGCVLATVGVGRFGPRRHLPLDLGGVTAALEGVRRGVTDPVAVNATSPHLDPSAHGARVAHRPRSACVHSSCW